MRHTCKEKVASHNRWFGGVDPANIFLATAAVMTPVIGPLFVLLVVAVIALIIVLICW